MWQDYVLAIGSVIFSLALIPSVLRREPPALATSIPTALVLFVFGATYASMGYVFAMITTVFSALLWALLALQRIFDKVG